MRAQSRAHDENEKRRRQHRRRNDVSEGQFEARVATVEQHQRAEEKGHDAARRQNAVRGREHVHDEQHHREAHQCQSRGVHGKDRRHVKHEDQRNRARDARQDRARIAQFADDPVNDHEHEHKHHLGPQEQLQEFLTRSHPDFKYFSFRRFQRFVADSAASELVEQAGQVVSDEVNDIQFERLLGRDDNALGDGRPGPLGVAMTLVCDGFDEAGGIVLHFLLHHVIGFFRVATQAEGNRMRSADSRVRRHCGYVGGHRDKRARTARGWRWNQAAGRPGLRGCRRELPRYNPG